MALDMSMCSGGKYNQENKADLAVMSVLKGRRVASLLPLVRSAVPGSRGPPRFIDSSPQQRGDIRREMFGGNGGHYAK